MTEGEYRVGLMFNPSGDDRVGQIKKAAADLLDLILSIVPPDANSSDASYQLDAEVVRLQRLAMERIEEGAMWAVKAATKPKPEAPLLKRI